MFRTCLLLLFCLPGLALPAYSADATDAEITALKTRLSELFPNDKHYQINKTPVPGLYEVDFGNSFIYITADGKHAVQGDIIEVATNLNVTEAKRSAIRLTKVESVGEKKMLIYPAREKRHVITVFTDIDCSYCRKMHNELEQYTLRGIEVRYLFYPRAGIGSASYNKAVSVWCADDRRTALTLAKAGEPIEQRKCDNPVKEHIQTAGVVGVTGTPTILLEDGTPLPGYVPAERLQLIMEHRRRLAAAN